jgi:predicted RNA binding protein YcfA (HicA-like mRNA interferase family)
MSDDDLVRAFQKRGFTVRRQQGSHFIMRRGDPLAQTVVPCHRQTDRGTLRAILRQTGITAEELSNLL